MHYIIYTSVAKRIQIRTGHHRETGSVGYVFLYVFI